MTSAIAFIRALCERLARGIELDPRLVGASLGTIKSPSSDLRVDVMPSDTSFSAAQVSASETTRKTWMVKLVPAAGLTLTALKEAFGPCEETPRLHPFHSRKFHFSPLYNTPHPYTVRVVAYVMVQGPVESARLEQVLVFCSPFVEKDYTPREPASEPEPTPTWPRLLGAPARFVVRALHRDSPTFAPARFERVRGELEHVLGIKLVRSTDSRDSRELVYVCELPACTLRLSSWPGTHPEVQVFNLIGVPTGDDIPVPGTEDIREAMGSHLRAANCDWYVPGVPEMQYEAGTLGDGLLERETIVAILAPRWLSGVSAEDRARGLELLDAIADTWLTAARSKPDPAADLKSRWSYFEGWPRGEPRLRVMSLMAYVMGENLDMVEAELFEIDLMSAAERAAMPELRAQLEGARAGMKEMEEQVLRIQFGLLGAQYKDILATIDRLLEGLPDPSNP